MRASGRNAARREQQRFLNRGDSQHRLAPVCQDCSMVCGYSFCIENEKYVNGASQDDP